MFTSKQEMTARETGAAHSALTRLLAARDEWYDGTVASVDGRLAALHNALPVVNRVAATDTAMLVQSQKIQAEIASLSDFKRTMLAPSTPRRTLPRVSSVGPLSARGREFISRNLRTFLAENSDALHDKDELDTRAENFAELKTLQLPVTESSRIVAHFRLAVDWNARNAQKAAPTSVAASTRTGSVAHVPDDALFD